MRSQEFPPGIAEHLGYYVYLLKDPETHEVFYVGKGTGNRVFQHMRAATGSEESDKLERIRQILARRGEVKPVIHRHGMTEDQALEVEAALIDFVGLDALSNRVHGLNSRERGPMTIDEIIEQYAAPEITVSEPAILIIINRLYRRGMPANELYEATRGYWKVGERRNMARYALAIYNGIVQQVYRIDRWHKATVGRAGEPLNNRWYFDGEAATELQHLVRGSVRKYLTLGSQNPVRYVNC